MVKTLLASVVFSSVLLAGGLVYGQSTTDSVVPITAMMTTRELEASGLRTLTPEQLDVLSTWIDSYRRALIQEAVDETGEGPALEDAVIDTRIDGIFDGWVGDTVFRLQNGQIWQQASPSARYLFAHSPHVRISRAPYTMRVEGLAGEIAVRRIK